MVLDEIKKFEHAIAEEKQKILVEFTKLDQCNLQNSLIGQNQIKENLIQIKIKVEDATKEEKIKLKDSIEVKNKNLPNLNKDE